MCRTDESRGRTDALADERGFSLVLVLLVIGALSIAAALFLQSVRGYSRSTAAWVSASVLEAHADSGVQMAILDIATSAQDSTRTRRIPIDGSIMTCAPAPDAALAVRVQDDAGRIDLNVASDRLIQALVRGLRLEKAEALADAILDYRDSDDNRRPSGAEAQEYVAAGRAYGPSNAPFLSIEELGQVLGMTPEIMAVLRPHVTLNSGLEGIDPAVARPELLAILARGETGGDPSIGSGLGGPPSIPQELRGNSMRRTFTIEVEARAGASRHVREAMIELTTSRARPFIVRRWARGEGLVAPDIVIDPAAIPRC